MNSESEMIGDCGCSSSLSPLTVVTTHCLVQRPLLARAQGEIDIYTNMKIRMNWHNIILIWIYQAQVNQEQKIFLLNIT